MLFLNSVGYYLQFFREAREHVGDALGDGSGLLEQQHAFRSCGKVQQAVQQRLLPGEPVRTWKGETQSAAVL